MLTGVRHLYFYKPRIYIGLEALCALKHCRYVSHISPVQGFVQPRPFRLS